MRTKHWQACQLLTCPIWLINLIMSTMGLIWLISLTMSTMGLIWLISLTMSTMGLIWLISLTMSTMGTAPCERIPGQFLVFGFLVVNLYYNSLEAVLRPSINGKKEYINTQNTNTYCDLQYDWRSISSFQRFSSTKTVNKTGAKTVTRLLIILQVAK